MPHISAPTEASASPVNRQGKHRPLRHLADLPGPKGWPLLGNLAQIKPAEFHLQLGQWAREHGRIAPPTELPRPQSTRSVAFNCRHCGCCSHCGWLHCCCIQRYSEKSLRLPHSARGVADSARARARGLAAGAGMAEADSARSSTGGAASGSLASMVGASATGAGAAATSGAAVATAALAGAGAVGTRLNTLSTRSAKRSSRHSQAISAASPSTATTDPARSK